MRPDKPVIFQLPEQQMVRTGYPSLVAKTLVSRRIDGTATALQRYEEAENHQYYTQRKKSEADSLCQ